MALRVFLFGLIVLGAALLFTVLAREWSFGLVAQVIEETILSWGSWGVVAAIGLMVVHSFVPFPAEFVAIANGMIYGPFWGTVITWSGAMLGAFLAFGLARWLGRPFVEAMLARNNLDLLDRRAAAQGGHLVFFSRFVPVIAFNLINYAAGLTRISWWTFGWATGIGILPLTILMVVMGDRIDSLPWQAWLLLFASGLILWLVFRQRFQQLREGKGRGEGEPEELEESGSGLEL